METLSSYNHLGGKIISSKEIINAINNSTKELRLLGTVVFNLPWSEYAEGGFGNTMIKKYIEEGSRYEISIVAESDPELHSYALTSGLDNDAFIGVPIATLEERRYRATQTLRDRLLEAGGTGVEPVEDKYRKQLDALYSERFAQNICDALSGRGHDYSVFFGNANCDKENSVIGGLFSYCIEKASLAFQTSDLVPYFLGKSDYFTLGQEKKEFMNNVVDYLKAKFSDIEKEEQNDKVAALFSFCDEGIIIEYRDPKSTKSCVFTLDSKRLRETCVECFLKALEEVERDNFEIIKEYASKEAYSERQNKQRELESDKNTKQRLYIKQVFHAIPVQMVMVDGVYYAAASPKICADDADNQQFLYIGDSNKSIEEDTDRFASFDDFVRYFHSYINSHYCTEMTKKMNKMEVIYNYTSNHVIIGQMPRDSFYGSDNYKLVMWALVFDRQGRILIHRRAHNAKDNQGLWDKSVGGHIAITDRDVIDGAAREIAEELYSIEEEEQSHASKQNAQRFNRANSEEIIYLGNWKETRYPNIGSSLKLEPNEFYMFNFESNLTKQPIDSLRILPNGTRIKAKCFADLYFVITSEYFDLGELKNSTYLVLPPQLIKRCARAKHLSNEIREEIQRYNPNISLNDISNRFEVTPDLEYIINSPEWDNEISKFSLRVKEAFAE